MYKLVAGFPTALRCASNGIHSKAEEASQPASQLSGSSIYNSAITPDTNPIVGWNFPRLVAMVICYCNYYCPNYLGV